MNDTAIVEIWPVADAAAQELGMLLAAAQSNAKIIEIIYRNHSKSCSSRT
jgi:hypothetical protein